MKKKSITARMISGLLSAVMVLQAAVTPITAFASEMNPEEELKAYVEALPELDQVKDQLDPEEVVTAKDYEVDFDTEIDLKKDFTNLEIPDKDKVKVNFYEAKNADKADFSTGMAGTYKAVYYVEPTNELHPVYRISRNITVKEPVTEAQTSAEGSEGGEDDASDGESEDADADPAPETSPESVAEVTETASPETAVETEEPHVVYEFTEEAYELEMAAAQETAQAMEEAGASSEQTADESTEESSSQAAEAASAEPEVTAADLAEALGTVLASENEDVAAESEISSIAEETEIPDETEREEETDSSAESSTMEEAETPEETSTSEEVPVSEEEPETVSDSEESIVEEPETVTITPEELDEMIEEAETQDTYDEESGWTVTGVIQWATEEEEIDLAALGFGESVSFEIPRKTRLKAASKSTQTVDITRGNRYSYSDYGLGSYVTFSYTVKFGDVKATAYCVQPSRSSPGDGTFTITKLFVAHIFLGAS